MRSLRQKMFRRRGAAGLIAGGLFLVAAVVGSSGSSAEGVAARTTSFTMCGAQRWTCVVDGDTIWLEGKNLRLQSFDTPEPWTDICGGKAEVALARRASARLLELLNSGPITVETFGLDSTGKRTLATVRLDGRDVGDILIAEKLARRWPDGPEWWCPR